MKKTGMAIMAGGLFLIIGGYFANLPGNVGWYAYDLIVGAWSLWFGNYLRTSHV
jgi:hypothetical protein